MRIRVGFFFFLLFLLMFAAPAWASEYRQAKPVSGEVDGHIISFEQQDYVILNERILVPPEKLLSLLEAKYSWNEKSKTLTADRGSRRIVLTVGKPTANVNGTVKRAMPSVQLHNSRPIIPLRLVSEALGAKVEWYSDTRTAIVITKPKKLGIVQKELLTIAAEGKMKGFPFPLGTPRQVIEKSLGTPIADDYYEGGQFFLYANCHCSLLYNEKHQLSILWLGREKIGMLRTADIRRILGKPKWEDNSATHDGIYFLYYPAGKNSITFHASSKHGVIDSLWLIDRPWE